MDAVLEYAQFVLRDLCTHGGYEIIEGVLQPAGDQVKSSLGRGLPEVLGLKTHARCPTGNEQIRSVWAAPGFSKSTSRTVTPSTRLILHRRLEKNKVVKRGQAARCKPVVARPPFERWPTLPLLRAWGRDGHHVLGVTGIAR